MRASEVEVETLTKPAGNWREYKTSHEFWGQKSLLLGFFGPAFIFWVYIHIYIHVYTCCCCLVTKSCPTLLPPHGLEPSRLFCPWDFPGKNTRRESVAIPFSRASSWTWGWSHIFCIADGFFTTEPPGKPPGTEKVLLKVFHLNDMLASVSCVLGNIAAAGDSV